MVTANLKPVMCSNVRSIYTLKWQYSGTYMCIVCSGAYANNVKCMYTRVPGHIFDSSEVI